MQHFGKVKKQILNNFDVTEDTYICEINITDILRYISKNRKYNPITKYPKVTRDLSIVVDKDLEYDKIRNIVKKQAGSILVNVELFDIYLIISVMFISQIYVSSVTSKLFNICFFTFPKCCNFLITYHIVYCLSCM